MAQQFLDNDVLEEVVSYYDPRGDRQPLLSLALASKAVSKIALSKLWSRCSSLEPIVCVINAAAPRGRKFVELLTYKRERSEVYGESVDSSDDSDAEMSNVSDSSSDGDPEEHMTIAKEYWVSHSQMLQCVH